MKKLLMTIAALTTVLACSAQWFAGGTVGFATEKTTNSPRVTTFSLAPGGGYIFNDRWSVALGIGYDYKDQGSLSTNVFKIGPSVRYNFVNHNGFCFFGEFGMGYEHYSVSSNIHYNGLYLGLRPGVSYMLDSRWEVLAKMNLFSFEHLGSPSIDTTGFGVNFTNLEVGVSYHF